MYAQLRSRPSISARVAARLLSAVASPAFPSKEWRDTPFWGRHSDAPFPALLNIPAGGLVKRT